jgi:hypothetical protein
MKSRLLILGATLLFTANAFADAYTVAKQRAKEVVNQNNVRQGVAPPTQNPSAPNTAPAPPALPLGLSRLEADLAAIKAGDTVTAEQKQKLAQDIIDGADSNKPSADAAKALADELVAAFTQKPLASPILARFVMELDAVLNPSKYPQAKMDGIYGDIQAIFQQNGLPRNSAVKIVDDIKALKK